MLHEFYSINQLTNDVEGERVQKSESFAGVICVWSPPLKLLLGGRENALSVPLEFRAVIRQLFQKAPPPLLLSSSSPLAREVYLS